MTEPLAFDGELSPAALSALTDDELDELPFGVVALTKGGVVTRYNRAEGELSGLDPERVLGRHFFESVAPCIDTALVAGRFAEAEELDETVEQLLALRLRPRKATLRLLKSPEHSTAYVLIRPEPEQ